MTTTPKLGIPLISSQQSQPEVTHNQMVVLLQALAGGAIDERNAAPASPAQGDTYIVGALPSGAFVGHAHAIAVYYGGWNFVPGFDDDGAIIPMTAAQNGLSIFNNALGELWAWDNPSWVVVTGGSGASRLKDLTDVAVSETSTEDGDALVWHDAGGVWIPRALTLKNLGDVQVGDTSTEDGDVLAWDDLAQKWRATPISIPSEGATALKDLSDVNVAETSTQDGDFLAWDDATGKWVATPINIPSDSTPALSELPDVHIVSPVDGDVLTYDGVSHKWVAEPGGGPGSSGNPSIPSGDVVGVVDGSNAPPGCIGEVFEAFTLFAAAVSPSNGVELNILQLNLPAGDFDVYGTGFFYAHTTNPTSISLGLGTVSGTLINPATAKPEGIFEMSVAFSPNVSNGWPVGPKRMNSNAAQIVYLVVSGSWTGAGSPKAWGYIRARRMR